ncbi:MAG: hypothetical protein LBK02_00135 [Treponema sp.]|jgi:hypothetical protein|nr:hypothetical protein [Treponema sp.]
MSKKNQVVSKEQKKSAANRGFATSAKAKVAAGVVGVATLFGPVACDNGTTSTPPKVCNCPVGTIHEPGENCCDGENCECIEKKYHTGLSVSGTTVTIEDRTATVTQDHVTAIQTALTSLGDVSGIVGHGDIIIIVENALPYADGKDRRIINSTSFAIRHTWLNEADDSGIVLNIFYGLEGMNTYYVNEHAAIKSDNVIRLANGKILNIDRVIELGKQFDTARETKVAQECLAPFFFLRPVCG